jgi:hypothetical protein
LVGPENKNVSVPVRHKNLKPEEPVEVTALERLLAANQELMETKEVKKAISIMAAPKTRNIVLAKKLDLSIPPMNFLQYTTLLYGAKGAGKTTGASTFPDNYTFMYEPRRRNIALRASFFEHPYR